MFLPQPGRDFERAPAGTYIAIATKLVDLGTQETEYKGKTSKKHKVRVTWELPDELNSQGEPHMVSKNYTFSMSPKAALRADLERWRGKKFEDSDFGEGGFNMKNILGKGCMLTLIETTNGENTYTNVDQISKPLKGMEIPQTKSEVVYFSMETPTSFDEEVYNNLSDYDKEKIASSPEYQALKGTPDPSAQQATQKVDPDLDDEVPF